MSCFHPLHGFDVGLKTDLGKVKYKIVSGDIESYFYDNEIYTDYVEIPCGKCIGCRLDYSRQWADRLMLEATYHDTMCFLTLTYDDDHLPAKNILCDDDGVFTGDSPFNPLVKKDLQDFMKRLRFHSDHELRFYACGEYGSRTFRPHYHMILYGEDFSSDRVFYKRNFDGSILYTSERLNSIWKNGYCVIGSVDWNSCAYVARYIMKKHKGLDSYIYEDLNFPPEFVVMSRKPGIARQYYDDHKDDIYTHQRIYLSTIKGSKEIRPPRYFDKLYDLDYPSDMARIKEQRRIIAENRSKLKDSLTDLSHNDRLLVEEESLILRTKILDRKEI